MRVAVLVIGLILLIVIGLQSCFVATGEAILGGLGGEEVVGGGGAIGLLVALLFGIAAAFALGKPAVSVVIFVLASLFAFMAGSTGFSDMKVWGVFALVLALLSFFSIPNAKSKLKNVARKWWFWLIVALVVLISLSTCLDSTDQPTQKKEQAPVSTKKTDTNTDQFVIQIGSKNIQVNDMELTLEAPVREIDWHSYIPLRFFLDWFEAEEVTYDRATETVTFKLNRCKEINPAVIEKYHGQKKTTKTETPSGTTKKPQNTPTQKETNNKTVPPSVNKQMVSNVQIFLKGAYYSYGDEMIGPDKGKKWVIIDLELENFSNESLSISSLMMFELIDEENYKADYALNINQRGSLDGELGIGRKMAGEITFEVPEGHHKFEFIFKPTLFGKSQAIFNIEIK
jgi:hypothetical protein